MTTALAKREVSIESQKSRFKELDQEFSSLNRDEAKEQKGRLGRAITAATILVEVYTMFQALPPGEKFGEFESFSRWMAKRCPDQEGFSPHGYSRAHCYSLLQIGVQLIPKMGVKAVRALPCLEHARALAKLAKAKGKVPEKLVEMCKTSSSKEIWGQVNSMIFQGNPSHEDGVKEIITFEAGSKLRKSIEQHIEELKPGMPGKTDAEVIELALVDCQKTLNAEEAERVQEISGVGDYEKLVRELAQRIADWAYETGELGQELATRIALAILDPAKEIGRYAAKEVEIEAPEDDS